LTPDEAAAHFASPFMVTVYGFDAPVSSSYTQELLGWSPTHPTLLDDLEHGDYFATRQGVRTDRDSPIGTPGQPNIRSCR
jgi:hypothetical protein